MTGYMVSKTKRPKIIGIAGGSCSGKTWFAERLLSVLGEEHAAILQQDAYYRDQSHLFDYEGGAVNFDDPASIDFDLLWRHLIQLQEGKSVAVPVYDFVTHKRLVLTQVFAPKPIVILEGALILAEPRLAACLSVMIFIEAAENLRLARRLKRDIASRGRTQEGVLTQFTCQVAPMHAQFIEPSKLLANYIVNQENENEILQLLLKKLERQNKS